jgi:YHS domain-containing protein
MSPSFRNGVRAFVAATLMCGALAVPGTPAWADAEVNVTTGATESGKGLAARGHDVVAYFTDHAPVPGKDQFSAVHGGAAYRFASQAHLDAFNADPAKYVPQYGGFCAFGCVYGKKFDGDPNVWKIVDGKLYFNLSPAVAAKWSDDTAGKIRTADEKWKAIEHTAVAEVNK